MFHLSAVSDSVTPQTTACQARLFSTISCNLLRFMSTESVMLSSHLILCCPLLLLLSTFPSTGVYSNELALHIRWPKYWSFSFSISSSKEYPGLIFLGLTYLISLESKGLSKISSSKVQKHQFFGAQLMVQLSHLYMTTGKTMVLNIQTFIL